MTDKQPEALRLADYCDRRSKELQPWIDDNEFTEFGYRPEGLKREQNSFQQVATELRRLHEVNSALVTAMRELMEDYKHCTDEYIDYEIAHGSTMYAPIKHARAALAKANGENND